MIWLSRWLACVNYSKILSSHIIEVQQKLSERALELLALPDDYPAFILDIGCGSGLSGEVLSDNGHYWVGMDISQSMLSKQILKSIII